MRPDQIIIADMIDTGSRVLDLGCGDGSLLAFLKEAKQVSGYGLGIDPEEIATCLAKGVDVIEHNLDLGLSSFDTNNFDIVIMAETLQSMRHPDQMLEEMLRIGKKCIVTLPNMGYWSSRLYLLVYGRMPLLRHLPYTWFDTPNIHLCTFVDFEKLVAKKGYWIKRREIVNSVYNKTLSSRLLANWLGAFGIYHIHRTKQPIDN